MSSPIIAKGIATRVTTPIICRVIGSLVIRVTAIRSSTTPIIIPKIKNSRNISMWRQYLFPVFGIKCVLSTISSPIAANGIETKKAIITVRAWIVWPVANLIAIKSSTTPIRTPKIKNSRKSSRRLRFIFIYRQRIIKKRV